MIPIWLRETTRLEAGRFASGNRHPLLFRKDVTHAGVSLVPAVATSPRVLEVVIMSDEQNTSDGLVQLIRRRGHAAHLAHDRREVLQFAAAKTADVILLDLDMPQLDACQLAKQLRVDFSQGDCFIIAVADRAMKRCRRETIAAGIDLVLIKPVDPVIVETLLLLECLRVNRREAERVKSRALKAAAERAQTPRWDFAPLEPRS